MLSGLPVERQRAMFIVLLAAERADAETAIMEEVRVREVDCLVYY